MKYQILNEQQKWSIVDRVEASENKARELAKLGISKSTFYDWKQNDCKVKSKAPKNVWNKTPGNIESKITEYRLSGDSFKQSPSRIMENLERSDDYLITESGVKSVLTRLNLNGTLRPRKKKYYIRPKADKFLDVVSVDDVEFIRFEPHDTYSLNFSDEASYLAIESRVLSHKIRGYDIIKGLKMIKLKYGKYPKKIRLDNARAHYALKVARFCRQHDIKIEFITKRCPEENWPVESWHRNLNQDLIYRKGYATIKEWQKAIDDYRYFHNYQKRLRSDHIQRTPAEIAFCYTTPLTQARIKAKLKRKHFGQTSIRKEINPSLAIQTAKIQYLQALSVSEMCVS
jgi:hypothetical protein